MSRRGLADSGDGPHLSRVLSSELATDLEQGNHQSSATGRFNRLDASPSRKSFSSFKTPARSYFQSETHAQAEATPNTSRSVREDTAELAKWALSDFQNSDASTNRPSKNTTLSKPVLAPSIQEETHQESSENASVGTSNQEGSGQNEPSHSLIGAQTPESHTRQSALTELIRQSSQSGKSSISSSESEYDHGSGLAVTVGQGIISQPDQRPVEQTALLLKTKATGPSTLSQYGTIHNHATDGKGKNGMATNGNAAWNNGVGTVRLLSQNLPSVASLRKGATWKSGAIEVFGFIPPVILGLLLNVLDALSYGMILFPLSQAPFTELGPDGISMFYISCIISQLVYSCGGSVFKGGIGSEMIEIVPFFHKMAFTILNRIGEDKPEAVLATTILAYSLSSVLTGIVFYLMGRCKIGALIGFFPRHILIGCIGGVGLFLVFTGLEVSGRLEGGFDFNIATLKELCRPETIPLWIIPLLLAILLLVVKHWIKHPLTDASYFIGIIAVFYFVVLVIPHLTLADLRTKGWIFKAPDTGIPFYHFYSLYNFEAVDWSALGLTVPAMFALTFFGVLHVPINIPALGMSTGEDNVDIDRELRAHGVSNALSGLCGSIQNYLVYTNTVLFMRSGGDSRLAGIMLAVATGVILVVGTAIIGYIPIMVVGSLIFFLGLDLMREALVNTWGRVHRLEYFTIIIIVFTMGIWDFVIGILAGIVLACVSYVLQTSQIPAIRGKLFGGVANSTVRRHAVHQNFLKAAGKQIHVMKMAGYLFFGTIVGVENQIRKLLEETFPRQPIRFLILDLFNVDGVDFSAGEAFGRIRKILYAKGVTLVTCGFTWEGEVGKSLRTAGLFDENDGNEVQYFSSLNSALEYCENELLKTLYNRREHVLQSKSQAGRLEVPHPERRDRRLSDSVSFGSPRLNDLHRIATTTLIEQDPAPATNWETYQQPFQLILQTFCTVSDQPESFWTTATEYFDRVEFKAGAVLYHVGDEADKFYLLQSGILKAQYDLPQGSYSELIVAGTTCGELPFFSLTPRTSTTMAEDDCVTWILCRKRWNEMQDRKPRLAQELLKIGLKLTSERMDAITKYMLLTSG